MGRLLAIDHGEKRIGLALSDPNKIISKPLKTISFSNYDNLSIDLIEIIERYEIEKLIIGLPIGMHGANTLQTDKVEDFTNYLKYREGKIITSQISKLNNCYHDLNPVEFYKKNLIQN